MWEYSKKEANENERRYQKKNYTDEEKFNKWAQIKRQREIDAHPSVYKKRPLLNASAMKTEYRDSKENDDFYFKRCQQKCSKWKNYKMRRKNPEYWDEYCEYCKTKTPRNIFSRDEQVPPPISNNPLLYTLPNPDSDHYSGGSRPYAFLSRKDNRWRRTSFLKRHEDDNRYNVFPPEYTYEMGIPCKFSDREIFELENTPYSNYTNRQKSASLEWLEEMRDELAENYCCLDTFEESEKCGRILEFIKKKIKDLKLVEPQSKKIYCPICKKEFQNMKVFRFHMSDQNKRYRIEAKKNRNIVGGRDWQLKNDIEDCAICHDPASTNKLLNARCNNELPTSKHYFHEDCLNTWVNTIPPEQLLPNNSCPRCRSANCRNLPLPKARRGDKIKVKKHPSYLLHNFYRNDYPRPDYPELSEEINPIPELLSPHLDADTSGVLMDFIGSSKRKPFSEY